VEHSERPARELLVDAGIERALLGVLLAQPDLADRVLEQLDPQWFASGGHQSIATAIKLVHQDGVVDSPSVALKLKQMGRLTEVGGTKTLFELESETPFTLLPNALSWREQLRDLWQRRALLAESRLLVAKLETNSVEDAFAAVEELGQRVELYRPSPALDLGFWGDDDKLGDWLEEPPQPTWLLCDADSGDPVMPLGRVNLMGAGGGTGKTTTQVQLAVCIAAVAAGVLESTDVTWCGFRVQRGGCVALFCGESDLALMRRQLWRALEHYGIEGADRKRVLRHLLLVPLAGKSISLVRRLPTGEAQRTELYHRIFRWLKKLATDGALDWTLLVFDPISRFGGADCEKDPASATAFIQALESFTELPGTPTVTATTHSSKQSLLDRRPDVRGSTAILDAARFVAVMMRLRVNGVNGILLSNSKNNEAPHFADRWLVQQTGRAAGMLRAATEAEAAMFGEELERLRSRGKTKPTKAKVETSECATTREGILKALRANGGFAQSRRWLAERSGVRKASALEEIKTMLLADLLTEDRSGRTKGAIRLPEPDGQRSIPFEGGSEGLKATEAER
jgi:hypothetical protein